MQRRTFLALPALATAPAIAADRLTVFGKNWSVPLGADWRVAQDEGEEVLLLTTPRPAQAQPRRPYQYALIESGPLAKFTLEFEARRDAANKSASLIAVYAWRDYGYFNYVHLSGDTATEQPVHNGVFHVYGGDRVRISPEKGTCGLPDALWHAVKIVYDAASGLVETSVDGVPNPSLRGTDLSLGAGRVGLGSFFNTGAFRRFRLSAE